MKRAAKNVLLAAATAAVLVSGGAVMWLITSGAAGGDAREGFNCTASGAVRVCATPADCRSEIVHGNATGPDEEAARRLAKDSCESQGRIRAAGNGTLVVCNVSCKAR